MKDTRHVNCTCATGSRDIVAESVAVPLHRVSPTPGTPIEPASAYLDRIPLRPMLSLTATIPSIGCARRALQLLRTRCTERVMFGQTRTDERAASMERSTTTLLRSNESAILRSHRDLVSSSIVIA